MDVEQALRIQATAAVIRREKLGNTQPEAIDVLANEVRRLSDELTALRQRHAKDDARWIELSNRIDRGLDGHKDNPLAHSVYHVVYQWMRALEESDLRQRHAEEVEKAFKEGYWEGIAEPRYSKTTERWAASDAKRRLDEIR